MPGDRGDKQTAYDLKYACAILENPPQERRAEWKNHGRCGPVFMATGRDMWFGNDSPGAANEGKIPHEDAEEARKVCRGCPVRAECLLYAMETGERHGIWAALTPKQRTWVKNKLAVKSANGREGAIAS